MSSFAPGNDNARVTRVTHSPFKELLGALSFQRGDHALDYEVVRGRIGLELELAHVVGQIEHLVRQGPRHEVRAEVVVEEIDVGAVGLPRGGVERAHPCVEELLHFLPPLLRHPLGEGLLEPRGVGVGCHAALRPEGAAPDDGGEERGGRVGGGGVTPVLAVEGAPRAWVRGQRGGLRGGGGGFRGELRLLRQRAGRGDRGAEEEVGVARAAEEERGGGRRRSHDGEGLGF